MEFVARIAEQTAQGGWVMWPLGACSLALWITAADRWLALRALGGVDMELTDAVRVVRGEAETPADGAGLRTRLVRAFAADRTGRPGLDAEMLRLAATRLRPELARGLAAVTVLAAVAPLLGLLGTVVGMVRTFDVIAMFGTGHARELAGGLSQALVTTQAGLLVAIPGLLAGAVLRRRARRLETSLDETAAVLERTLGEMEAAA